MLNTFLVCALACFALTAQDAPLIDFPHPLVTEILYAVPKDASDDSLGDASGDGSRDATGDEFIELINPHDEPIDLAGYVLTDAHPKDKNRFEFVFPELTLEPGQAVVVFNGKDQSFGTSTGSADDAGRPQTEFNDAYVLSADNDNRFIGLANKGDGVALWAPDGSPICYVWWGSSSAQPPKGCPIVEEAPSTAKGSIVLNHKGQWKTHAKSGGVRYSPGVHPTP